MTTKTKGLTFVEAIRTNAPLCRPNRSFKHRMLNWGGELMEASIYPGTFIDATIFIESVCITKDDILAEDWEVKNDNKN